MIDRECIAVKNENQSMTLNTVTEWLGKSHNRAYISSVLRNVLPKYQAGVDSALMSTSTKDSKVSFLTNSGIGIGIGPKRELTLLIDAWKLHNMHLVADLSDTPHKTWANHAKRIVSIIIKSFSAISAIYPDLAKRCIANDIERVEPSLDARLIEAVSEAIFDEYYSDPMIVSAEFSFTHVSGLGFVSKLQTIMYFRDSNGATVAIPLSVSIKLAHDAPINGTDDDLKRVIMDSGTDSDVSMFLKTEPHVIFSHNFIAFGNWNSYAKVQDVVTNLKYVKYLKEPED